MGPYFWMAEEFLPGGLGFGLFGVGHLLALVCCAALMAALCLAYRRAAPSGRVALRRALALALPLGEVLRDAVLAAQGAFFACYWPLQLCSLAMFLAMGWAVRPNRFCGEILYSLCLPGALGALVFPAWAGTTPLLQFQSLYGFWYHSLVASFVLMLLVGGDLRPQPAGLRWPLLFLACLAPPIWVVDRLAGTNFCFLAVPAPGSPLVGLRRLAGAFYPAAVVLLAGGAASLFYLPLWLRGRGRNARQGGGKG